jgi:hypothetical protein
MYRYWSIFGIGQYRVTEPMPVREDLESEDGASVEVDPPEHDKIESSATMILDEGTLNDSSETLLRHVRVNSIGDYYDIPQLRRLAITKLERIMAHNWNATQYLDVCKESFKCSSDTNLHHSLALVAVPHMERLVALEGFAALEPISDFGVILRLLTDKLTESQSFVKDIRARLERSEKDREHAEAAAENLRITMEKVRECHEILRKCNNCPHCFTDVTCMVEEGEFDLGPHFSLCCKMCDYGR